MMDVIWVGAGGFLGAVARWVVTGWFHGDFPWGTMAVNLGGSLVMGAVMEAFVSEVIALPVPARLFFLVGFLGSFTTFSTFSLEAVRLLESRTWPAFFLYASQVLLGPLMVILGMFTVRVLLLRR